MLRKKIAALRWWEIALISIVASAIGGLASGLSKEKEQNLYKKKLKQAPWSPPAWAFGPAWTINNFFLLLALQRLLSSDIPGRRKLLILQLWIWIIFFSFGYVYFNKKSPVLAAVWTMSDAALAAVSLAILYKTDRKTSLYYLPLVLWTGFASTVADYQVLKNPDPVFNTRALLN